MANAEATLTIKVKEEGKKALDGISDGFSTMVKGAAAAAAALAAVGVAVGKLALDAAQFDDVKKKFTELAASQGQDAEAMLKNMQELTKGTVSELELMKKANAALLLGLPVDRFDEILLIAQGAAQATGESMDFMLNSIVTGLGRQSKLMLDNLGIIVETEKAYDEYAATLGTTADKLTDAEKKTAFLNKALEVGKTNLEAMGGVQESTTLKWERFKANTADATIQLGQAFVPALTIVLDSMNELFELLDTPTAKDFFQELAIDVVKGMHTVSNFFENLMQAPDTIGRLVKAAGAAALGDFGAVQEEIELLQDEQRTRELLQEAKLQEDLQGIRDAANSTRKDRAKATSDQIGSDTGIALAAGVASGVASSMDIFAAFRVDLEGELENIGQSAKDFLGGGLQGAASDGLAAMVNGFLPGFGEAAGAIFDLLSKDADAFEKEMERIFSTEFLTNVFNNLTTLLEALPGMFDAVTNQMVEDMPDMAQRFVEAIIANLPEISSAMVRTMSITLSDPEFIADLAVAVALGAKDGFNDAIADIAKAVAKAFEDAIELAFSGLDFAQGGTGGATSGGQGFIAGVLTGVGGVAGAGIAAAGSRIFGGYHGGVVPGYQLGGVIDNTLIAATPGEFVVNRASAEANIGALNAINSSNGRAVSGGNNITIVVNGGLLGDKNSAREFARAVDDELYNLRQGRESRAFDEGAF